MSLSDTVCKFIEKEKLFATNDKLLLGVSGGIDSMVMLHLLHSAGYEVQVAHVNYKLRQEASDLDEQMVRSYCSEHEIPCHIHVVSTEEQDQLEKDNLQAVARNIRYRHFEQVKEVQSLDFICTAHHMEDRAETFFLNALRGSGLRGLASIKSMSNLTRRPLLLISKKEIVNYASKHRVTYRDDLSNQSNKYNRNYIRHQILSPLKERWPTAITSICNSATLLQDSNELLSYLIAQSKDRWLTQSENTLKIGPISAIRTIPGATTLLYELMKPYRVSADMISRIIDNEISSGSTVESRAHEIIVDRDYILIELASVEVSSYSMDQSGTYEILQETQLHLIKCQKADYNSDQLDQYVDAQKVIFPLSLRTWKEGDRIQPLGMDGKSKLVSDILTNAKVDVLSKRKVWILSDANDNLLWVVGHRLSEICKISEKTTDFMNIRWDSSK